MTVHYHDFRPVEQTETTEAEVAPATLAALLDYVAKDIDPRRFGVAYQMVVSAADWLRQHPGDL
jgi:hypothetical protein